MPNGAWAGKPVPTLYYRTHDPASPGWCVEPWLQLLKKEYVDDRTLPVWNPYQGFGAPLAANMQSQAFSPVTVVLALVHSPRTYNWYILCRLFVAGFFAYLYARLFVSFVPAIAAGISSMLAGYYMLFVTMPHLSVEVLLPAALWGGECILRTPRFRTVMWFAVLIFFVFIGGMPESSLLLLAMTYAYFLFRIATDRSLWAGLSNRVAYLATATIAGCCFSAIVLLPFRQFLRYSYDVHQFGNTHSVIGLLHDSFNLSIFTYLLPFIYGTYGSEGQFTCANYFGVISLLLIIAAIMGTFWRQTLRDRTLSQLTVFFGIVVIAVISKRYGFFLVNWIGSLPLFNLIIYDKYEEPLLSIAVAFLCAIGLERLSDPRMTPVKQVTPLALCYVSIALALSFSKDVLAKEIAAGGAIFEIVGWSIVLPLALLTLLSLCLMLFNSESVSKRLQSRPVSLVLSSFVLAILACEMIFNYIVPTYYVWNSLPTMSSNPYAGAPYIDKLKQLAGQNRIFAEDAILYPNWSSAFGLFDVRDLDAMYYRKYLPFVQSFLRLAPRPSDANELANRFTGAGGSNFTFQDYLQQRLLQLSSTKYVVTPAGASLGKKDIIDEMVDQGNVGIRQPTKARVELVPLNLGGAVKMSLGGQAPLELHYTLTVDRPSESLRFSYGIPPEAFAAPCGDGAEFTVEAKTSSGAAKRLFSSFIDPKHIVSLRKWNRSAIDLTSYYRQKVDLLFSTNGGPKGDICGDWTYWSDFQFDDTSSVSPFTRVYDHEVNIYEYNHVLPRAAIYYHAAVRPNESDVLKSLGDPGFDVFGTVLLNRAELKPNQLELIGRLGDSSSNMPADAARIVSYEPTEVQIVASLQRRGILVLNDSDFPGWRLNIDGKPGEAFSANYLFRGVFLEAGRHIVRFTYRPWSLELGSIISSASLSGVAVFGFIHGWRRRRNLRRWQKKQY